MISKAADLAPALLAILMQMPPIRPALSAFLYPITIIISTIY